MPSAAGLRFLRPHLSKYVPDGRKAAYIRFFTATQCFVHHKSQINKIAQPIRAYGSKASRKTKEIDEDRGPIEARIKELEKGNALKYPRIQKPKHSLTLVEYQSRYGSMIAGEKRPAEAVAVCGRVTSVRVAGKTLCFVDIDQEGHTLQVVCLSQELSAFAGLSSADFQRFYRLLRRGDIISVEGVPYSTKSGEVSISASELPVILSPSLPQLPTKLEDPETRVRNRHVDMLVNKKVSETIRLRSHIIQYIRDFLIKDSFLEVQTPIVADSASGAIARPFITVATEFSEKQLTLRIAPEIWLKRLILGGMDRVFEIGPAFRNEGLDATHNAEFTTCEFYKSFSDLEDLISMTENMLSGLAKHVTDLRKWSYRNIPELDTEQFNAPFKRLEFIPEIEKRLGEKLPNLAAEDAQEKLLTIFTKHKIAPPSSLTLPRLLDKLSSIYLEPDCTAPTFIMHHPACLAPLAKSFKDPKSQQLVSARVELFIQNREIANMYEEENSPFEQRKKFLEQAKWRDEENTALLDESYLEALEWGLPPTGGFGCGIDRLCMLFSGATRISEVLAFGSLKNVVNLGREVVVRERNVDVR
ncbi:Lysyl-tRNA synthetase [Hyphodiscus hymeniophilus]|uniref:Lysine--tRNA ligase n=1 Tax=Hyphodiscus hymeniophilus TaxID=353542 RepID=A0A9P6VPE6_9HELO|nr:Lysyl-tRNA synthetase [Hyphodiscus hymeniophilus]